MTEEQVRDVPNATLVDLVASGLAITQETMDRVQQGEEDAIVLKQKIKRLEQFELEKATKKIVNVFNDHVLLVFESNTSIKKTIMLNLLNYTRTLK